MKHPSRSLRLVLAGAVGAGLALGPIATLPAQATPTDLTIALLNFNDFHGRIDANTTKFATTIEQQRATYGDANTLLLSAGDNIGASLFASATQADQPTIDVLNALNLKASAVGNHEFDKGWDDLKGRVINGGTNAKWDYLGANVYAKGTTTPVLPEYSIQTVDGIKVGIIGVVTQETASLVSPAGISTLTFGDEVAAINRVAAQLKDGNEANGEAQVVVAEVHDGASISDGTWLSTTPATPAATLNQAKAASSDFADQVNNTSSKVDVLFNGHTHQTYAWTDPNHANRPVVQAASYGTNLGKVVLTVNADTKQVTAADASVLARATTADTSYPRVAAVDTITSAALAHAAEVGNQAIGQVSADITTGFKGGSYTDGVWTGGTRDDRAAPSTMGRLVADALLASLSDSDRGGAEIGVVNPGGLRAELTYKASGSEGDGVVTYAEANAVLPFVNNLWTTTLTGAQLKQVLEEQWQPSGSSRPYLALGLSKNVTYTSDPTAAKGSHITSVWVNGKQLSATDKVRVGTFSFLTSGGDNFTTMAAGSNAKDSGLVDYEAWIDYLKAHKPVAPDFAKAGANLAAAATTTVGEKYSVEVGDLNLTSLGSPANTSLEVRVGNTLVTTVPVSSGAASATFTVPNTGAMTLTAKPSNTVVRVPVTISPLKTTTTLKLTKKSASYGTALTATTTVTGTSTGTVRFTVAGRSVTAALTNGVATVKLPNTIPVGKHAVVASFVADDRAAASSSAPVKIVITKANVQVVNKADVRTVKANKSFTFTVTTKPLGLGVWATGTLKTTLHGHQVAVTSLKASNKGTVRITIAAKYLKWYGKGSSVSVVTKLTSSSTTNKTTLKLIRLHLV